MAAIRFYPQTLFALVSLAIYALCLCAQPATATQSSSTKPLKSRAFPPKVYGVNIGSWLVLEPWMLPSEWASMGGQTCDTCSNCIMSEFALVKAYPSTADALFQKHWETWFTQDDVNDLVAAGINTVRLPLGYWIVEGLVDRSTEYYPRGGIVQLQRGMKMLSDAGINVILDHHALPGVQTPEQMFTGQCTTDVEFYTEKNYQRALVWAAVMTSVTHLDPSFSTVSTIEAANEVISNASQTPGYGTYMENFVQVVRLVELGLLSPLTGGLTSPLTSNGLTPNVTEILSDLASALLSNSADDPLLDDFGLEDLDKDSDSAGKSNRPRANTEGLNFIPSTAALTAIISAAGLLPGVAQQLNLPLSFPLGGLLGSRRRSVVVNSEPLQTAFMDILWQYAGTPSNPADAANGPAAYDDHLYYAYGGVADATEEAYLKSICNLQRIQEDDAAHNTPMYFGEWSLATQFTASDTFLSQWADAQKYAYSEGDGAGWIFWNFKIEQSSEAADLLPQWSYLDALEQGLMTQDPSKYNDPDVCAKYITA